MEEKSIEKMELSGRSLKELWIAAKWAKLLSIMTLGFYFIFLLIAILTGLQIAVFAKMVPYGGFFYTIAEIIIYTLTLLIPGLLLYGFASKIQDGIRSNDEEITTKAMKRFRQLFQYSGILMIVVIALLGISIVYGVISSIL